MRVVSLVPSATETLVAWGVEPVAVTRFCEQPSLLAVGGTKNPDVRTIVGLRPDLVVMCDEENRREDADALAGAGLHVHVVSIRGMGDVAPALAALARAVGTTWEPDARWRRTAGASPPTGRRAFVPIWRRPWMTLNGDTYGASVLRTLGVGTLFADSEVRYPEVDLAVVASRRPDVVLVPSEPYAFSDAHCAELATIAPVRRVDGRDLFWWGVRTPDAVARLGAELGAGEG